MDHIWGIPLTLFYIGILFLLIKKWRFFNDDVLPKKAFYLFFTYKVFMGMMLTAIYTFYYKDEKYADIYKYYTDSYHMTRALWDQPSDFFKMLFGIGNDTQYFTDTYYSKMNFWFRIFDTNVYNDNHTIIRFNAVVRLFSFGYFHIHTLFMSFLSFLGMVCFYKGFKLFLPLEKHRIFAYCLFLFPSLAFWSSGNLKEGILIFTLGSIFLFICDALTHKRIHKSFLLLALFSLFIALYIKTYALVIMMIGLSGLTIGYCFRNKHIFWVYSALALLGIVALIFITYVFPQYNIPTIIAQKHDDFIRMSLDLKAGSYFNTGQFENTWGDLLQNTPIAFFTGLFRPTLFDAHNPIALLSAMESLVITVAIITCFVFYQKPKPNQLNMIYCCAVIVILLSTLIGISSANFGSLVRYKIPLFPFIVFTCVCLIDMNRIKQLFRRTPHN